MNQTAMSSRCSAMSVVIARRADERRERTDVSEEIACATDIQSSSDRSFSVSSQHSTADAERLGNPSKAHSLGVEVLLVETLIGARRGVTRGSRVGEHRQLWLA